MSVPIATAHASTEATRLVPAPPAKPHADDLLLQRSRFSNQQHAELEALAYRYASVPEAYDIAVSDGYVLKSACGEGAMSVLADGKFWHVSGSLLAPERLKPDMIQMLKQISERSRRTIAVYNVSQTDAMKFQQQGFVVNKFGEEAILDPAQTDWKGRKYEWVRRQTNFCRRAGLAVASTGWLARSIVGCASAFCPRSARTALMSLVDVTRPSSAYWSDTAFLSCVSRASTDSSKPINGDELLLFMCRKLRACWQPAKVSGNSK